MISSSSSSSSMYAIIIIYFIPMPLPRHGILAEGHRAAASGAARSRLTARSASWIVGGLAMQVFCVFVPVLRNIEN